DLYNQIPGPYGKDSADPAASSSDPMLLGPLPTEPVEPIEPTDPLTTPDVPIPDAPPKKGSSKLDEDDELVLELNRPSSPMAVASAGPFNSSAPIGAIFSDDVENSQRARELFEEPLYGQLLAEYFVKLAIFPTEVFSGNAAGITGWLSTFGPLLWGIISYTCPDWVPFKDDFMSSVASVFRKRKDGTDVVSRAEQAADYVGAPEAKPWETGRFNREKMFRQMEQNLRLQQMPIVRGAMDGFNAKLRQTGELLQGKVGFMDWLHQDYEDMLRDQQAARRARGEGGWFGWVNKGFKYMVNKAFTSATFMTPGIRIAYYASLVGARVAVNAKFYKYRSIKRFFAVNNQASGQQWKTEIERAMAINAARVGYATGIPDDEAWVLKRRLNNVWATWKLALT
ncbi:MAG: hypothetical protein ACPHYG_06435, partial [Flavobacteriales bacterium]